MAIGVCVGLTPTIPLHTTLSVLFAFLLRKSKLAAALGVWVANPFLLPFIYILDYKVGMLITGAAGFSLDYTEVTPSNLLELGWEVAYPMLIGGLVIGLLSILPTYFLTKRALFLYRGRERRRLEKIGLPSQTA